MNSRPSPQRLPSTEKGPHISPPGQPAKTTQTEGLTQIPPTSLTSKLLRSRTLSASLSLALLVLFGLLATRFAEQGPLSLSRTPSMFLFAAVPLCVMLLAWTVRWTQRLILGTTLAIVVSFAAWNWILLQGLTNQEIRQALVSNARHWLLFLASGLIAGRYLQWSFGFSISDQHTPLSNNDNDASSTERDAAIEQARGANTPRSDLTSRTQTKEQFASRCVTQPSSLSISKLLLLITLIALLLLIYLRTQSSQPRAVWVDRPWYEIFPAEMQPSVSGILGGLLVPLHWAAMGLALRARTYRTACLVLWLPVIAFLRWWTAELYLPPPSAIMGSDALSVILQEPSGAFSNSSVTISHPPTPISIGQLCIESILQWCLTLASFYWLHQNRYLLRVSRS